MFNDEVGRLPKAEVNLYLSTEAWKSGIFVESDADGNSSLMFEIGS